MSSTTTAVAAEARITKLADLPGWLAEGRVLPSKFLENLNELIRENNPALVASMKAYEKKSQLTQLQDAIFGLLVARMDDEWETLFKSCTTKDAKDLSANEKKTLGVSALSLVYGEVTFSALASVFAKNLSFPAHGGTFYDVGSGSGRGVFGAVLLHHFAKAEGIEILTGLHAASEGILTEFNKIRESEGKGSRHAATKIAFHREDLRKFDWSDGDVVFANSTCFDETLMNDLSDCAERLKQGAYIITLTKRLRSEQFRTIESIQYKMSWGYATVHTQIKLTPPSARPPAAAADASAPLAAGLAALAIAEGEPPFPPSPTASTKKKKNAQKPNSKQQNCCE